MNTDSVISRVRADGSIPARGERVVHIGDEARVRELQTRDVDRDTRRIVDAGRPPDRGLATRFEEHPAAEVDDDPRLLRERDERVGRDESADRIVPAGEGFERRNAAGVRLDDRLVVHGERLLRDRSAQRLLELHAFDRGRVHRGLEHPVAALAFPLGAVHRGIGVAQQQLGRDVAPAGECDTDARADPDRTIRQLERELQGVQDALRGPTRLIRSVQVVDEDRELVASEPGDGVEIAKRGAEALRDRDEQCVAGEVAEAVVDCLEAVEIDDHHREVAAGARAAGQRVLEPVVEEAAVGQGRERVVHRLVAHHLLGPIADDRRQHDAGDRLDELVVVGGDAMRRHDVDVRDRQRRVPHGDPPCLRSRRRDAGLVGLVGLDLDHVVAVDDPADQEVERVANRRQARLHHLVECGHRERVAPERRDRGLALVPQVPVGDVARVDDEPEHCRIVQQVGRDALERAPAAVDVTDAHRELGTRAGSRAVCPSTSRNDCTSSACNNPARRFPRSSAGS